MNQSDHTVWFGLNRSSHIKAYVTPLCNPKCQASYKFMKLIESRGIPLRISTFPQHRQLQITTIEFSIAKQSTKILKFSNVCLKLVSIYLVIQMRVKPWKDRLVFTDCLRWPQTRWTHTEWRRNMDTRIIHSVALVGTFNWCNRIPSGNLLRR
jgi:hypothetical protein